MSQPDPWSQQAPSLADFEQIAARAYAELPELFRRNLHNLTIRVEDFPSDAVLREMGTTDPFQITGLYDGVALTEQSIDAPPVLPACVWLYRRPILDEWAARGDVALDRLIAHVLVHEIAHHLGYSDADIAAIDDWRV